MSCGCGVPDDRHGDRRHITLQDLIHAALASGPPTMLGASPVRQVLQNMLATLNALAGMGGLDPLPDDETAPPMRYVNKINLPAEDIELKSPPDPL